MWLWRHQGTICWNYFWKASIYTVWSANDGAARDPLETCRNLSGHGGFLAKRPNQLYIFPALLCRWRILGTVCWKPHAAGFKGGFRWISGYYIIDRPQPCMFLSLCLQTKIFVIPKFFDWLIWYLSIFHMKSCEKCFFRNYFNPLWQCKLCTVSI